MDIENGLLEFLMMIGHLKKLKRAGWVMNNVSDPESVASHMYRMSIMALVCPASVDREKCIKMALVHDLAECTVGDITPFDGITDSQKKELERSAFLTMKPHLPEKIFEEIFDLWNEYEDGRTAEAIFVKDLDKFDMILTAYEYEKSHNQPYFLEKFFRYTKDFFKTDVIKNMTQKLIKKRQEDFDRYEK